MRSEADVRFMYKVYKALHEKDNSDYIKGKFDALAWVLEEEGL